MKVYMAPRAAQCQTDNGIGRVVHAMERYLPEYGVAFTDDRATADILAFHAGTATSDDKRVDLLINHGLYWSDVEHYQFSRSNNVANQRIIDAARRARIITVPSEWVAEPFRRDMRINPRVIGHGIDADEWDATKEHAGYILWNKNRPTDVCDPSYAWKLAEKGHKVVSTFGPTGKIIPHLRVTGQLPFREMKALIEQAELYLATTPETFGIGTLEAMISGVPVLGFDWCGTSDLVRHKETGWLCPPGDFNGLVEGVFWLREHRAEVGANAREFAKGYDWSKVIGRYYQLFTELEKPEPLGVTVVITNYNYGKWVKDAILSCQTQNRKPDEILVVDDGSTDQSLAVLKPLADAGKIRLIAQKNQGVAAARNHGIAQAKGELILCLDADDMISPEFLAATMPAMERDRGLGVAYTGVRFIDANGHDTGHWTYKPFNWEIQAKAEVPPPTCIPSGSLFRKEMWRRKGGYVQRYAPGEDTEFWTGALALGFTAEMVTAEPFFRYRGHAGSASRTKKYGPIDDNKPWMRDKLYPMGAPAFYVPAVRSYLRPVVSVIIPVGPGHDALVEDAIESVVGQTVRSWELVLVDDTGDESFSRAILIRYPFLRIVKTAGKTGAGAARNRGIERARGEFVYFLDADDWLRWDALDQSLQAFARTGRYTYSDFYLVKGSEKRHMPVYDYDRENFRTKQVMHSVNALVPRSWVKEVGGFDESLPGWEEYDFYMKLAVRGYCGEAVRQPLFYYRYETGERRKVSHKMAGQLNDHFREKFGGAEMSGCCGNASNAILEAKRALGELPRETITVAELPNEVRLEFTGPFMAPVAYQVNGRTYYGAKDDLNRFINAPREDVPKLVASGKWRVVLPPPEARQYVEARPVEAPPPPPPAPVAVGTDVQAGRPAAVVMRRKRG
jgi:glycosyltransferase involved in cell wall biosynthesis